MQSLGFYSFALGPILDQVLINRVSKERGFYQVIEYFSGAICKIADKLTQTTKYILNYFFLMLLLESGSYQEFDCNPKM